MKRTMVNDNTGQKLEVAGVVVLMNGWEYFLTELDNDIVFALVDGFEMECGDVCISEIKGFAVGGIGNPHQCLPARGWNWAD